MTTHDDELLTSEGLGRLLGLGDPQNPGSGSRAINLLICRGSPMPPSIVIPGLRGRRWRRSVVLEWLKQYERTTATKTAKRGRPRKIDRIAQAKVEQYRQDG